MGIDALKNGFITFLKELKRAEAESTTAEEEYAVNDFETSIFSNANEFKAYIQEELNMTSQELTMSVSDILNMDIVNGKLISADKTGIDSFENNQANSKENISNLEVKKEGNETSIITGILNSLFNNKNVINAIDTSKNNKLDENEIKTFLETIKEMDGNANDLSLEDILQAIEKIKNETSEIKAAESSEEKNNAAEKNGGSSEINQSNNSSSGDNSRSPSGESSINQNNSNKSKPVTETKNQQDVSKMTLEELNNELKDTESVIEEGENTLSSILDGTESGIANLKKAMDDAYATYQKELEVLNKDMAKELDDRKKAADKKEEEVDSKEKEIISQKNDVRKKEGEYNDAVETRKSLESTLSSLESALASAEEEEKSSIEAQIATVKAQLEQAKIAEEQAKRALEAAKSKLEKLEGEKKELETEQSKLEQDVKEYEQEIAAKHPEIAKYQKAYNDAKTEHDTYKTGASDALKSDLNRLYEYRNKINAEITTKENTENQKEYNTNNSYDKKEGEALVDTAKAMLNKYGSSSGYCATGVSRTFSMAYGIEMSGNGCDWDTNMEKLVEQGKFKEVTNDYPSSNDLSNLPAGAVVCWENTGGNNGGGAQYGHVTIADGKGGEISDHYQKEIYKSIGGRDDQYRIFIPV